MKNKPLRYIPEVVYCTWSLQDILERHGWTYRAFSKMTGISPSNLHRIAKGITTTEKCYQKIVKAINKHNTI